MKGRSTKPVRINGKFTALVAIVRRTFMKQHNECAESAQKKHFKDLLSRSSLGKISQYSGGNQKTDYY